jgi:hypothetical protein
VSIEVPRSRPAHYRHEKAPLSPYAVSRHPTKRIDDKPG